jgi:hypothetical protein
MKIESGKLIIKLFLPLLDTKITSSVFEILDKNKIDAMKSEKKLIGAFAHRNYSFTMLYYTYFGSNRGTTGIG